MTSQLINQAHGETLAAAFEKSGVKYTCAAVVYDAIADDVGRIGASRQAVNIALKIIHENWKAAQ